MKTSVEKVETPSRFKDYFSTVAQEYSRYRPTYPPELFAFLSSLIKSHDIAWDCATGNGQAAFGLTPHIGKILASDASERQIVHAHRHTKIQYVVSSAECSPFYERSIDLITIATAIHWFDFEKFYREVNRVMKPNGVIAAWCYGWLTISPEIDALFHFFKTNVLGAYWTPERRYVDEEYKTIPFPFDEILTTPFVIERYWNIEDVFGYLDTWSSSRLYKENNGESATEKIRKKLEEAWGGDGQRLITWPVYMRVGRI